MTDTPAANIHRVNQWIHVIPQSPRLKSCKHWRNLCWQGSGLKHMDNNKHSYATVLHNMISPLPQPTESSNISSITLKRVRNWSLNILPASCHHTQLTFSWLHLFENQATKPHTIQFHATAPSADSGVIVDHHLAIRLGQPAMSQRWCIMSLRFSQASC